jgi:hypothetical protein
MGPSRFRWALFRLKLTELYNLLSGKTALAKIIASAAGASFNVLNATMGGVGDVRKIIDEAKALTASTGR